MNLKSLPWWGQVTGAAIIALFVWWFGSNFTPTELKAKAEKVASLEETLEAKEAEIRRARRAAAKLEELEREISDLELKLADLKQILPTQPEIGDLLKWIKSLADQTNLDLRVFNPQSLTEQEFLREQPIRMEVVGSYHQLGLFFDRIGKYARIINVEDVRVTPNRGSDRRATIQATFVAKTYIFRDLDDGSASGGDA
ncbi:MAG: type 4a pilus biogenesis protein PilO [Acidobacteriota bacterium]|nr:MAG: type 4a pilus biogenesis protein PilO [Acidobacteriota bacterium]